MQALVVQGLQAIARLLDKAVPLQGGRTTLVAALSLVGAAAAFFSGQINAEAAALIIMNAVGTLFASLHKTPPAP